MIKEKFKKTPKDVAQINLPDEFLERMKTILGAEFDDFQQALNQPKQSGLFVNEKIDVDYFKQIVDFDISPIAYESKGFYVNEKLGKHPLHHAGAFYMQEPSAMFTVNALAFKGNEKVLDLCAAPGGKSIQIANRIPNGVLVSNEINSARCAVLFSNMERMGLKNVVVANDTPSNIANAYANSFDVVLVDAPCSGEGMFRRGEAVVNEWNANLPRMCADRQLEILNNADRALKQNGFLIYSTCTYSYEENEGVVSKFLQTHDYKLINIDAKFSRGINLPETVRLYPHKVKGEGQFVAVLQKLNKNEDLPKSNLKLQVCSQAQKFVRDNLTTQINCFEYGDFAYAVLNESILKKGVNYYSIGVRVGSVKDKRFEPSHNLFTAFGKCFKLQLDFPYTAKQVQAYLKGEIIDANFLDGYGAFMVSGCPVGGFKIANGMFKNHYPKGLRNFN